MGLEVLYQYNKERDKAVKSLDVEKFKKFCKKWGNPVPPTDEIIEIVMRKMMYHINSFSPEEKESAKKWLEEHGSSTDLGG